MNFAAVFPGQGSQYVGMGKDLCENFSLARQTFEEASESIKLDLKDLCFNGPESDLKLTVNTQPALLTVSIATWRVLEKEADFQPKFVLGHSLGEYSALVASQACKLDEAVQTVRVRGKAMQESVPVGVGGMTALLGMDDSMVIRACQDFQNSVRQEHILDDAVIEAANFNCPGQVVISGHLSALDYMKSHFKPEAYGATRGKMIPLPVSAPFHCSLMKTAAERLRTQLEKVKWANTLGISVIHNVNSKVNVSGGPLIGLLFDQMTKPVQWTQSIRTACEHGVNAFIEIGAGKVLSGLIKKIESSSKILNIDTVNDLKQSLKEMGQ